MSFQQDSKGHFRKILLCTKEKTDAAGRLWIHARMKIISTLRKLENRVSFTKVYEMMEIFDDTISELVIEFIMLTNYLFVKE